MPAALAGFFPSAAIGWNIFPFEYGYESRIEAIEGAAQFVELSALRMLDAQKYEQACARLQDRLSKLDALLPVRISCYDSGAAMLQICAQSHHSLQLSIGDTELIFYQGLIDAAKPLSMVPETTPEILAFYEADQAKLRQLVENARSHPGKPAFCHRDARWFQRLFRAPF